MNVRQEGQIDDRLGGSTAATTSRTPGCFISSCADSIVGLAGPVCRSW
jgi:hypothetical protein